MQFEFNLNGTRRHSTARGALALILGGVIALAGCASNRAAAPVAAGPAASPKTALWVGNSFFYYNNSMHGHVGQLLANADPAGRGSYRSTSATISGSGINWHDLEAHFRPGGVGSYSFDGPDVNLYIADKRHPTLAGTYLGACTVLASVYGRSPVGNAYTAGLPADVAAHLQAVAWETVQGFRQP